MRISRYIKFPLIFGSLMALPRLLFLSYFSLNEVLGWFIYGVVFGVGAQLYSDYRTRKIKPDAEEKDFSSRNSANIVLLYDYDEAFDLCLESVEVLRKGKLKCSDKSKGFIRAKTGMNWNSWGNIIEFQISKLSDSSSEITIRTIPIPRTVLVGNGEGLKAIEDLKEFFVSKNEDINRQLVEAKFDIPTNNNIKDFENVKIKNQ